MPISSASRDISGIKRRQTRLRWTMTESHDYVGPMSVDVREWALARNETAARTLLNSDGRNHVLRELRRWRASHHGGGVLHTDVVGTAMVLHDVHHCVVGLLG